MPAPAPGTVRVLARANVAGMRAGRWYDRPDDERTGDLVSAGLASLSGYRGEPAPADLPPPGCCGQQ